MARHKKNKKTTKVTVPPLAVYKVAAKTIRKAQKDINLKPTKVSVFPQESPKTGSYSVSLAVNDKTFVSAGETIIEALNNIKIEPTRGVLKIYTKGILKVRKGDKEVER